MIYVVFLLIAALVYLARKHSLLKSGHVESSLKIQAQAEERWREYWKTQMQDFRERELSVMREQERESARLAFESWKVEHTKAERADAVKISRAVNKGLISEQFAPYLSGWNYAPKDCAFLGKPVDYIVFDGLDSGELKQIVLVDVKTGQSQLNARERQVRDAVAFGRVKFETFRPKLPEPEEMN